MIALSLVLDFPIEFLCGDAHFLARKTFVFRLVLRKERNNVARHISELGYGEGIRSNVRQKRRAHQLSDRAYRHDDDLPVLR